MSRGLRRWEFARDLTEKAAFRAAFWLTVAAALWLGLSGGGRATEDGTREKIVVEFALPAPAAGKPGAGEPERPAATAARILSRLRPEAARSALVFEHLPMLALDANAETLLRLVRMPEVVAIRPDRAVVTIPLPENIAIPETPDDSEAPEGAAAPESGAPSKDDAD